MNLYLFYFLPPKYSLNFDEYANIDKKFIDKYGEESRKYPIRRKQSALFSNIPLEVFFQICKDLPPSDLLALVQTCSRFHFILMDKCDGTQGTWKKARMAYFKGLQRPPPPS